MVKIDLKHFFDKRWQIENSVIGPLEEQAKETEQSEKIDQAWDKLREFFPRETSDLDFWEQKSRVGFHRDILGSWKKSGAAIFTFRDDLLEMFRQSDIMSLPIRDLRWPYDCFYLYFGEYDLFPDFDPEYRIDGCLVSTRSLFSELDHGRVEPLTVISRRLQQGYSEITQQIKKLNVIIASWERVKAIHPEAEEHIASCLKSLTYWDEREGKERDITITSAKELARQEAQRTQYQVLQADPDNYTYDRDDYLGLDVEFTVKRKDGKIASLTGAELLKKPYLRAMFNFDTHRDTVSDVIDRQYRENWYGHDHYNFDYWDNMVIADGDPDYIINHGTCTDGTPYRSFKRINTHLNTTNRTEYLAEITSLVFNALCYLDWKDRDVVSRYSDPKLQTELDQAPTKKQERIRHKARQLGYRQLWYCGYSTPRTERSSGHNGPVATHWRRGHWRRQAWGKGRTSHRLTWIKPVIVNQTPDVPTKPIVYQTAR